MTCHVHSFDAREGGSFRISLTYDEPTGTGRRRHTPTRIAAASRSSCLTNGSWKWMEFETEDPALRGEMTITITLADADGGTNLLAVHDGLPPGVSSADNETGRRMALASSLRSSRRVANNVPSNRPGAFRPMAPAFRPDFAPAHRSRACESPTYGDFSGLANLLLVHARQERGPDRSGMTRRSAFDVRIHGGNVNAIRKRRA